MANPSIWAGIAIGYYVNMPMEIGRDKMDVRENTENLLTIVSNALGTAKRLELTATCFEDLKKLQDTGCIILPANGYAAIFIGFLARYVTTTQAAFRDYDVIYNRESGAFIIDILGVGDAAIVFMLDSDEQLKIDFEN